MTALILAGGRNFGKKTILEALVRLTTSIFNETFIISDQNKNYQQFDLRGAAVLNDFLQNKGPLVGLYTGLSYSTHQASCVLTCDKPIPEASLLRDLAALWREDYDAVCPEDSQGHLQAFPGIYRRASRHFVRLLLDRGETTTHHLFDILVVHPLVLHKKESISPN